MDMAKEKWTEFLYQTLLKGINNDSEVLKLMSLIAIIENYISQKKLSV